MSDAIQTPYADALGVMREGVSAERRELHAMAVEIKRLRAVARAEKLRADIARVQAIAAIREAKA